VNFFNYILTSEGKKYSKKFEFVIDVADALIYNVDLFRSLGVPVLGFGKSTLDKFSLLLPDPHMVLALGMGIDDDTIIPPALKGNHKRGKDTESCYVSLCCVM